MPDALGAAASLAGSFAVLLLAAKAHGRQVRLEREAEGFAEVDFAGPNPPWVEALWARDRRAFLGTAALAAVALALARFGPWGGPLPLPAGTPADPSVDLVVLGLWAGVVGFCAAGLASLGRLLLRLARRAAPGAAWRAGALRSSALWWALALGATGGFWSAAAYLAG